MNILPQFAAGDSVTWLDDPFEALQGQAVIPITSGSYSLTYSLRGPATGLDIVGTAQGSGWQFAITPAQSAALNTGTAFAIWYWQAFAAATGVRYQAGAGQVRVDPNFAALSTGTPYDGRSLEEVALANIKAELAQRITGGGVIKYTIGNRSLEKETMANLLSLQSRYEAVVARQKTRDAVRNGQGNPSKTFIRFGARR